MDTTSTILITGASGLAGTWLRKALEQQGFSRLFFLDMISTGEGDKNREFIGSVCDRDFIHHVIEKVTPSHIFHLAGIVGHKPLDEMLKVNVEGTQILLEEVKSCNLIKTRILITSSSAVYGDKGKHPITEDMPTSPTSNYSISKAKQEEVGLQYVSDHNIQVIISRAFNNIAPGEKEYMFISRITSQIVKIENRKQEKLQIGPLHSYRDYIDTRDLVDAYIILMKKGTAGQIYNICTGKPRQIKELFTFLINSAKVPVEYEVVQYNQKGNIPYQCGNPGKIKNLTGWEPKRDIKETLTEILDYWRAQG